MKSLLAVVVIASLAASAYGQLDVDLKSCIPDGWKDHKEAKEEPITTCEQFKTERSESQQNNDYFDQGFDWSTSSKYRKDYLACACEKCGGEVVTSKSGRKGCVIKSDNGPKKSVPTTKRALGSSGADDTADAAVDCDGLKAKIDDIEASHSSKAELQKKVEEITARHAKAEGDLKGVDDELAALAKQAREGTLEELRTQMESANKEKEAAADVAAKAKEDLAKAADAEKVAQEEFNKAKERLESAVAAKKSAEKSSDEAAEKEKAKTASADNAKAQHDKLADQVKSETEKRVTLEGQRKEFQAAQETAASELTQAKEAEAAVNVGDATELETLKARYAKDCGGSSEPAGEKEKSGSDAANEGSNVIKWCKAQGKGKDCSEDVPEKCHGKGLFPYCDAADCNVKGNNEQACVARNAELDEHFSMRGRGHVNHIRPANLAEDN